MKQRVMVAGTGFADRTLLSVFGDRARLSVMLRQTAEMDLRSLYKLQTRILIHLLKIPTLPKLMSCLLTSFAHALASAGSRKRLSSVPLLELRLVVRFLRRVVALVVVSRLRVVQRFDLELDMRQ
jgi:hypothetical protein